jgi:mannose-1-phosphate guanylyltransferase
MIDWLARHGVDDVVLACGFLPDRLREVLGDGAAGGPRLTYVEEPEPRGTAGAIKFASEHLADRFLALNGDVLTDLDLTALMRHHDEAGAVATLGLYPVDDPSAYGLVRHRDGGEITEFLEKPDPAEIDTDEVNAGTYVLERSVLDEIAPNENVSIERDVFPRLVGRGLHGIRLDGYWMDIGTPERYLQASWDILEGRVETDVTPTAPGVFVDPRAEVDDSAAIGPRAVIGAGCRIGPGAVIESSVLLEGCSVGEGAEVRSSILAEDVRVAANAAISGTVLGRGERVSAS